MVKTYNNIARDSFLRVMIHSLLRVIIHTLVEQKVDGKHTILTNESLREQNAFHMTHISPVLRLEPWRIFTRKLVTQQHTSI